MIIEPCKKCKGLNIKFYNKIQANNTRHCIAKCDCGAVYYVPVEFCTFSTEIFVSKKEQKKAKRENIPTLF